MDQEINRGIVIGGVSSLGLRNSYKTRDVILALMERDGNPPDPALASYVTQRLDFLETITGNMYPEYVPEMQLDLMQSPLDYPQSVDEDPPAVKHPFGAFIQHPTHRSAPKSKTKKGNNRGIKK